MWIHSKIAIMWTHTKYRSRIGLEWPRIDLEWPSIIQKSLEIHCQDSLKMLYDIRPSIGWVLISKVLHIQSNWNHWKSIAKKIWKCSMTISSLVPHQNIKCIKYINTKKWFQGSRVSLAIKKTQHMAYFGNNQNFANPTIRLDKICHIREMKTF